MFFGEQAIVKLFSVQTIGLCMAFASVVIMYNYMYDSAREYLRLGKLSAFVREQPSDKPKVRKRWVYMGIRASILFALLAFLVIHAPRIAYYGVQLENVYHVFPIAVIFAFTNSMVEEIIARVGIVVALKSVVSDSNIAIISGVVFAFVQYFTSPLGMIGFALGGFMGWFLAKSILETKGIFWAICIHFVCDVFIFSGVFLL